MLREYCLLSKPGTSAKTTSVFSAGFDLTLHQGFKSN